ncbi:efflux RND transporter periplasmic adaptor subunit [Paludisphaera sp.]|uniref:efflux RND transporter periplasmic adaptor subunit n=1 Tax=Paludisphaera sp. TaxID=2017432 RepID=UPI00301D969C
MIAIAAAAGASLWAYSASYGLPGRGRQMNLGEKYQVAPVSRTVLEGSLTTQGRLESSKRTVIECELERVTIGVAGRALAGGGSSILLTVIPDGSAVKQGDVLATLDSSPYEELLRQQKMTVERARSDHRQADLDLEVAKLAVEEYKQGVMAETLKDHDRLIALAESEMSRGRDRLDWATRMNEKGYVSLSVLKTESQTFDRAEVAMEKARGAREVFEKFTSQKVIRQLEGVVLSKQASLHYQSIRLGREIERLERLEKQVENCTIRAPHDGFVIYANDPRRDIVIEPGLEVRQKQHLFYLPDLRRMEVVALLHESIVDRVKGGMKARIALEAVPDIALTGRIRSIAPLPLIQHRTEVRYFEGIVSIDEQAARDLMPGMTAQVEVAMPPKGDVLAVPVEAVTSEEGGEYCYVLRDEAGALEKRKVALGQATHDMLEVSEGLNEGERVVLNPRPDELLDDLADFPAFEPEPAPAAIEAEVPVAALH